MSGVVAAQSRNPIELASVPAPQNAKRIAYGKDPLQFGELVVPATPGPHPVAIVVHGGCYLAKLGNYPPSAVALDNMHPMAIGLNEAGIATWNVEYRRLGNPGGGWPGTYLDVAAATDFLRMIAKEHQLDLTRAIAIGHSAGGHLAMWLASRSKIRKDSELFIEDPLKLRGAVNLDGPTDLELTRDVERDICGDPVVTQLMGGSRSEHPERYQAASPLQMLPSRVPQYILGGAMFGNQAGIYQAAARGAGETVPITVQPDAGHFLFIDPKSTMWPEVMKAVRAALSLQAK